MINTLSCIVIIFTFVMTIIKRHWMHMTNLDLTAADVADRFEVRLGVRCIVSDSYTSESYYNRYYNRIVLGDGLLYRSTVRAVATMAHELGHAMQPITTFSYLCFRVRVLDMAIREWHISQWYLFIIGMLLQAPLLVVLGIAVQVIHCLNGLVLLPTEYDASRRALNNLDLVCNLGERLADVRLYLVWTFLTYVRSVLFNVFFLFLMVQWTWAFL